MSLCMWVHVRNGVSDRNSEATPCVEIDFGDLIHPLRAGMVSDLCKYEKASNSAPSIVGNSQNQQR